MKTKSEVIDKYRLNIADCNGHVWKVIEVSDLHNLIKDLSEIEPDNEKPKAIFKEKYFSDDIVNRINKMIRLLDNENEKPYLFYEGEKYYFGEEYEFSTDLGAWEIRNFNTYYHDTTTFGGYNEKRTHLGIYNHIGKIDHTTKYKKLFLELKEQAEKDGVNLKELI